MKKFLRVLVTNDDGISAKGIWILARELSKIAQVAVVAPDRERSASGTSVTMRQPLRVRKVEPQVPGIEAYAVGGTPGDSVILALVKLLKNRVDMVVSGINRGVNLGDDVYMSGTVAAALQGYLHGINAIAVSVNKESELQQIDTAARLSKLLVKRITFDSPEKKVFLNVNIPNLPFTDIHKAVITRLDSNSHTDWAKEVEDNEGRYYQLERQQNDGIHDDKTDILRHRTGQYLHYTPLHAPRPRASSSRFGIPLRWPLPGNEGKGIKL